MDRPKVDKESHPMESGDDLVQVAKADDKVCKHVLDDFPDCHSGHGFANAELVGNGAKAVRCYKLPGEDGEVLCPDQGWPYADVLPMQYRGSLSSNVHEGSLAHVEALQTLISTLGVFPPVIAHSVGPLAPLYRLEMLLDHLAWHGVHYNLIFITT